MLTALKSLARRTRGRIGWLARDSKGFALLESVMAVTIFAFLGSSLMIGIRTANISGEVVEDHSIAEKLARNQMEYVRNQTYASGSGTYVSIKDATDVTFAVDTGYTGTAQPLEYITGETDIEKVMVTVKNGTDTILILETLRAKPR